MSSANTTVMPDPRCPRFTEELKVGDTAYFVLVHIEQKGSRKQLRAKLREWYQQKQSAKR